MLLWIVSIGLIMGLSSESRNAALNKAMEVWKHLYLTFWKQNLFIALLMPAMHIVLGHFTQFLTFWIRMTISVLEQDLRLMLRCSSGGSAGYLQNWKVGGLVPVCMPDNLALWWSMNVCQCWIEENVISVFIYNTAGHTVWRTCLFSRPCLIFEPFRKGFCTSYNI